jgi:hypothetical protein
MMSSSEFLSSLYFNHCAMGREVGVDIPKTIEINGIGLKGSVLVDAEAGALSLIWN